MALSEISSLHNRFLGIRFSTTPFKQLELITNAQTDCLNNAVIRN
jgi:hypothetical protein